VSESYLFFQVTWKIFFFILLPPLLGPQPDFSPVCDLPATQEKDRIQEDFHLVQVSHLSYIYLGYFVCLCVIVCVCVCVCVSQFVAERSAILLVLIIKLTQETRRRVWRGRDIDGEIGNGQIGDGGCEETFLYWSINWVACRFTVPSAFALLNYISSGILWRIFFQTGIFAGFSLYIIDIAGYTSILCFYKYFIRRKVSEAAMRGPEVGGHYFSSYAVRKYDHTGTYINFDSKWIWKGFATSKTPSA
jgi:hypothetical protein